MSTSTNATIDTVRTDRSETDVDADGDPTADGPVARRIVDISEFDPDDVRRYVRDVEGGVHFERKGGRTFLVAG